MVVTPGAMLQIGSTTVAVELDRRVLAGDAPLGLAGFRGMVGSSAAMQALFARVARLDGSLLPILLTGETGVGKELVARALHEGSRVADGPFVAVNCGALARELVASTLFGHKKGAFTGATDARKGAFGAADGGTLLLDEIGELPLELQPALLRALETGDVVPVGEDVPRQVAVRVVAATNRDLEAEVRAGKFREDLYYRLAVVTLAVPPLRERLDDVPLLGELFARQEGAPLPADVLEGRASPVAGNVRELRNAVRWVALGQVHASKRPADVARSDKAPERGAARPPVPRSAGGHRRRFTALYRVAHGQARGNQTAAADGRARSHPPRPPARQARTLRGRVRPSASPIAPSGRVRRTAPRSPPASQARSPAPGSGRPVRPAGRSGTRRRRVDGSPSRRRRARSHLRARPRGRASSAVSRGPAARWRRGRRRSSVGRRERVIEHERRLGSGAGRVQPPATSALAVVEVGDGMAEGALVARLGASGRSRRGWSNSSPSALGGRVARRQQTRPSVSAAMAPYRARPRATGGASSGSSPDRRSPRSELALLRAAPAKRRAAVGQGRGGRQRARAPHRGTLPAGAKPTPACRRRSTRGAWNGACRRRNGAAVGQGRRAWKKRVPARCP